MVGIPLETDEGDFDYVRAKKGGLDAPFMSIYIPASYQSDGEPESAKVFADSLIDMVQGVINLHPDNFSTGNSTAEVEAAFKEKISKNDLFDLVYTPNGGIQVLKNSKTMTRIQGLPFKKALFGIWLSAKPAQSSLKAEMLGKEF